MRWFSNLGLVVLNTVILRAVFPLAAVGMAAIATEHHWGLFNALALPQWQVVVLSVIGLDLIIYLQHVLFHSLPTLWRLHKVHHADLDFDVTTGLRIHHSVLPHETNSNFGFNLTWWDYVFGTYRACPSVSQQDITIGLSEYQKNLRVEQLHWMLILPFLNQPSCYPISQKKT